MKRKATEKSQKRQQTVRERCPAHRKLRHLNQLMSPWNVEESKSERFGLSSWKDVVGGAGEAVMGGLDNAVRSVGEGGEES